MWFIGAFSFPPCWVFSANEVLSAIFFHPSSPSALFLLLFPFFSTGVFPVGQVPVPFLLCGGSWLGWADAPVMGVLFQSRGRLPIVEAPGYSRRPTSILMMQLFTQHIMNFYFDSHRWSHKGHKVSLLRTKSHPMQQEEGKSLAIIIIDFKVKWG